MSLNSHFKNIILASLLSSPAWVHLLDSVLQLMATGKSFLSTFKLFLGFKNGVAVETLPAPVDESGFNPVWVDPLPVVDLLRTQGFSEDFLSTLELLPTGVGRLNCSSPYMCFKVFNALGIPRSSFMLLSKDLSFVDNSRKVDNFLLLTGVVSFGVYTYKSLSPLRDGDLVYTVTNAEPVPILSYSEEFIDLGVSGLSGAYSIERVDSLYPTWNKPDVLAWVYSGVPSQLVYDRYSPVHTYGTAYLGADVGEVSVEVSVPDASLAIKYWLVYGDLLSVQNGVFSEAILDRIAIKEPLYKTTTQDWVSEGRKMSNILNVYCLTMWDTLPVFDTYMCAYLFNLTDAIDLYELLAAKPLLAETPGDDEQLTTENGDAIAIPLISQEINFLDVSVFLLFDTSEDYTFGLSYGALEETVDFTWVAATSTASLGPHSVVLSSLGESAGLAFNVKDSYVTAQVNGIQIGAVTGFDELDVFNGFTEDALVYSMRVGRSGVWCSADGVYIDGVLSELVSFLSTHKVARLQSMGTGSSTLISVDLLRYNIPIVFIDTFSHSWVDLEVSWDFSIIEPTYFRQDGVEIYDLVDMTDNLNNGIIDDE